MSDETSPLLLPPPEEVSFKERLGRSLEGKRAHWTVVALTTLDACLVLSDIGWDFLKDQRCICTDSCGEDPPILEWFSYFSLIITSVFLLEIPLSLWSFGRKHYTTVEHAYLHLFDAVVIIVTFCLEVFLRGREAEIAGLLVILRLWRLIKLVSTVSVDVTEYNDVEAPKPRSRSPSFAEDTEAWWAREKQALIAELEEVKEQLEKANGALTRAVENGFA